MHNATAGGHRTSVRLAEDPASAEPRALFIRLCGERDRQAMYRRGLHTQFLSPRRFNNPEAIMTPTAIDHTADRLRFELGWRFMMCPEANLSSALVALIGLNPGGRERHGSTWSCETGNAYWDESWGGQPAGSAPLQRQVQQIAHRLGVGPSDIFAGQFVPFRSPSWADLPNPREAVAFARDLWAWTLDRSPARTLVCLGKKVVGPEIATIVGAGLCEIIPAGWGDQTIDVYRSPQGIKVIALPHLGRFKLMGRPASEAAVLAALA